MTDTINTINSINAASSHPISLVIVGVGNGDFRYLLNFIVCKFGLLRVNNFSTMNVLDADDKPLGKTLLRIISYFIGIGIVFYDVRFESALDRVG